MLTIQSLQQEKAQSKLKLLFPFFWTTNYPAWSSCPAFYLCTLHHWCFIAHVTDSKFSSSVTLVLTPCALLSPHGQPFSLVLGNFCLLAMLPLLGVKFNSHHSRNPVQKTDTFWYDLSQPLFSPSQEICVSPPTTNTFDSKGDVSLCQGYLFYPSSRFSFPPWRYGLFLPSSSTSFFLLFSFLYM